jgi:hypothetical protein
MFYVSLLLTYHTRLILAYCGCTTHSTICCFADCVVHKHQWVPPLRAKENALVTQYTVMRKRAGTLPTISNTHWYMM